MASTFGICALHKRKTSGVHAARCSALPRASAALEYDTNTRTSANNLEGIGAIALITCLFDRSEPLLSGCPFANRRSVTPVTSSASSHCTQRLVARARRPVQLQTTFCCVSSLKIDVLTEQPFLTGWQPNLSQATCGDPPAAGGVPACRTGAWRLVGAAGAAGAAR